MTIEITDSHVAALRAMVTGDLEELERLERRLGQVQEVDGHSALFLTAFMVAVERRFGASRSIPEIVRFVADVRAHTETSIDPRRAEKLIRTVLGDGKFAELDDQAKVLQVPLLLELVQDERLSDDGVDQFLDQARARAQWLVDHWPNPPASAAAGGSTRARPGVIYEAPGPFTGERWDPRMLSLFTTSAPEEYAWTADGPIRYVPVYKEKRLMGYLWASLEEPAAGFEAAPSAGADGGNTALAWVETRLRPAARVGAQPLDLLRKWAGAKEDSRCGLVPTGAEGGARDLDELKRLVAEA